MQTVTQTYKDAIARTEQHPIARAKVDWNRDGNPVEVRLDSVRVDRSITSDLPETVTLLTGHSVAEAVVGLAGDPQENDREARPAPAIYSPYQDGSELADLDPEGAPVTVELGYRTSAGDEFLSALTGTGRDLPVVAQPASAELEALDGFMALQVPAQLPAAVGYDASLAAQGLAPGSGLNSQWVIDALARQGGYYASPPPRSGCILSATLSGSLQADVGLLLGVGTFLTLQDSGGTEFATPTYAQGVFGLAPAPPPHSVFQSTYTPSSPVSANETLTITGWAKIPATPGVSPAPTADQQWAMSSALGDYQTALQLRTTAPNVTVLELLVTRNSTTTTITGPTITSNGWTYVGVKVHASGTSATAEFRAGTTGTTTTVSVAPSVGTPMLTIGGIAGAYGAAAVQIDINPTIIGSTVWDNLFTPNAVLERGKLELLAIPPLPEGATCADLIQQVAAAEAAVAMVDENNIFRYWSRDHWKFATAATEIQRTITATSALKGVAVSRLADRVRNVIRAPVSPLVVGPPDVIWELKDIISVPGRSTVQFFASLDGKQGFQISTDTHIVPAGGATDLRSGYRAARNKDGTGGAVTNLVMTVTPFATSVLVEIFNPNGPPAWLVSPHGGSSPDGGGVFPAGSDGKPCVVLCGRLIGNQSLDLDDVPTPNAQSTITVERRWGPSIEVHGTRVLTLDTNPWLQRIEDANDLLRDILHDTAWPMPQLSTVDIVADPALMLGDRIQLVDDSGTTGINDPFVLVSYTTEFEGGEDAAPVMAQSIVLKPIAPPRSWILSVHGRSELGLTTRV